MRTTAEPSRERAGKFCTRSQVAFGNASRSETACRRQPEGQARRCLATCASQAGVSAGGQRSLGVTTGSGKAQLRGRGRSQVQLGNEREIFNLRNRSRCARFLVGELEASVRSSRRKVCHGLPVYGQNFPQFFATGGHGSCEVAVSAASYLRTTSQAALHPYQHIPAQGEGSHFFGQEALFDMGGLGRAAARHALTACRKTGAKRSNAGNPARRSRDANRIVRVTPRDGPVFQPAANSRTRARPEPGSVPPHGRGRGIRGSRARPVSP